MPCQCATDRQRKKCVWWVGSEKGLIETNDATGEDKVIQGCLTDIILRWLVQSVKYSMANKATVEQVRNKIADMHGSVNSALITVLSSPLPTLHPGNNPLALEYRNLDEEET